MIVRQLIDQVSSTYSYLVADERSGDAVLVKAVFEQHARDAALIGELGLVLRFTLDTHCHADHVTGAWLMKQALGSEIGMSPMYGATHLDLAVGVGLVVRFGDSGLEIRAAEVTRDRPVVVVCQTGKRSGLATTILRPAGVTRTANLAGGMVRWRELGLPS